MLDFYNNKIIIISISIVLVFFLLKTHLYAQKDSSAQQRPAKIQGTVMSEGEPVPFINVLVKDTHIGTTTNPRGRFNIKQVPTGEHTLVVKGLSYKRVEKSVTVEPGEHVKLSIQVEEDALQMEDVVVTGTRTEHYVKQVPVKTEVIPARQIESQNASNLYQALKGVPGVQVQQQCQFCNFTSVRMQGLESEYSQILVNGLPIYSGLASVYGLQQVGTPNIERIEIVKGAGSALYGSSAIAGAINIITRKPSLDPMTTIDMQWGGFNTNNYKVTSSLRNEKGNVGAVIYGQRSTGDAVDYTSENSPVKQQDGISDRVQQNLTNAGASVFVENLLFQKDRLVLRGRFIDELRRGGDLTDNRFKNPFYEGSERILTNRYAGELTYESTFEDSSELQIGAAYIQHDRNATNDAYLTDYTSIHQNSPPVPELMPYLANENTFSSIAMYDKTINSHHILTGIQLSYSNFQESGKYLVLDEESEYFGVSFSSFSKKQFSDFGIFVQDEISLSPNLQMVPGVRYDYYTARETYTSEGEISNQFPEITYQTSSLNPRLALKYDFSRQFSFRFSTGTGFRPPAEFSEDLHLCSGSPRIWKSSRLNPERALSFNLAADYYGENLRLGASIFRTNLYGKIDFTGADPEIRAKGYNYQWENIGDASVQGLELSWRAELTGDLAVDGNLTFNRGFYKYARDEWEDSGYEDESKYISKFPLYTGHLGVEYSLADWKFSMEGNYEGPMYIDYYQDETIPVKIKKTKPYLLLDAKVARTFRTVTVYARMENVTDYVQPERHLDDAAFIYAPLIGRMYYAGIKLKLKH
ncbi:MAG: TonB-dependent receptor [Bacteroidota bacterium]